MFFRRVILLLWLSTASLLAADGTAIEFLAVMSLSQKTSVQLVNTSTGTSAWVPVGQTFGGYTVSDYNPKTDLVTLTKNGVSSRLLLKSSKLTKATALSPEEQARIQKAVLNNLRQLGAACDQYYLENGKTSVTLPELVGPEKYIKELKAVDGEDYTKIEFKIGKELSVTTANGITVTYSQ